MKVLVIVESPAKAKTIAKYLNELDRSNKYVVKASLGHVRDLDKKKLGINVDDNFAVDYQISPEKKKTVADLLEAAKGADIVYLASDNDREGESIAWHLREILPKSIKTKRIVFNEITKAALNHAINNTREIDEDLVEAQQARRIVDRLVGYKLSPVLWKHFTGSKLSAGRVQSAALHMLVEHENIIKNHVSEPYWMIETEISFNDGKSNHGSYDEHDTFAKLYNNDGLMTFTSLKDVKTVMTKFITTLRVADKHDIKQRNESAPLPFITTTLQQEASSKLGLSITTVMKYAQELYEAGHITYMRTDSTVMSNDAKAMISDFIQKEYGAQYYQGDATKAKGSKNSNAQGAHECIRPTTLATLPGNLPGKAGELYSLIFKRGVASQMKPAIYKDVIVKVYPCKDVDMWFQCKTSYLVFEGYLKMYGNIIQAITTIHSALKSATCDMIRGKNIWKSAPSHYNEASLIHLLEKEGIGRPSTYACILDKLYDKQYVEKTNIMGREYDATHVIWRSPTNIKEELVKVIINNEISKLRPTEIGITVDAFMSSHFQDIVDKRFTSDLEIKLDNIANGTVKVQKVLHEFWKDFQEAYTKQDSKSERQKLSTTSKTFESGEYVASLNKYGPVLVSGKRNVYLKAYLGIIKKNYLDMNDDDAAFIWSLPCTIGQKTNVTLLYGRYGFYMQNGLGDTVPVSMKSVRAAIKGVGGISTLKQLTDDEIREAFKNKITVVSK